MKTKKRRVIVIIESNNKLLVHKKHEKWSFPDSFLDWPLDKRQQRPIAMATWMLKNTFHGLLDKFDEIKKLFKNKCRIVSPSDYYVYYVKVENIEESLKFYNLQRKFLGPEVAKLELHDYEKFYDREHGLYLGSSIEAFGCLPSIK